MEKINNIDLSVIILSYKSKENLRALLPSIFSSTTSYAYEVIVVDNGSNDGTFEWVQSEMSRSEYQNIKAIQNINNGFAAGNNVGIKEAEGRYVLLLNPDTKVEPETFEVMLRFMDSRPDVGISGCKLVKADGTLDLACRRRFPNPSNSFKRLFLRDNTNYNYSDLDENVEMEVDSVVGAFMLIRREVVEKIGLLDETFFMYGEDLDYCFRCKEAGYKVWYYPKTKILHYKAESSGKTPIRSLMWHRDAMRIFYAKHYAKKYPAIFNAIIYTGIYTHYLLSVIGNSFKPNKKAKI